MHVYPTKRFIRSHRTINVRHWFVCCIASDWMPETGSFTRTEVWSACSLVVKGSWSQRGWAWFRYWPSSLVGMPGVCACVTQSGTGWRNRWNCGVATPHQRSAFSFSLSRPLLLASTCALWEFEKILRRIEIYLAHGFEVEALALGGGHLLPHSVAEGRRVHVGVQVSAVVSFPLLINPAVFE